MNVYEVKFANGSMILQFARSYPECFKLVQRYQMTVVLITLVKGTDDVSIAFGTVVGAL